MRDRLRRDLTTALKAHDRTATAALRSLIAAIDNAEAPQPVDGEENGGAPDAGVGLGAGEGRPRELSDDEIQGLVESEMNERSDAANECDQVGRDDVAGRLRDEAGVLARYAPT